MGRMSVIREVGGREEKALLKAELIHALIKFQKTISWTKLPN